MKKTKVYFTSLRNRIIAFFLASSFVPFMILGGASWYNYQNTINNNTLSYTQQVMSLTADKLKDFIHKLDQFYFAVYSKNLPSQLSNMELSSAQGVKSRLTLRETLMQLQGFYGLSHTVPYLTIVSDTGNIFYQNDRALTSDYCFLEESWFTEFMDSDDQTSMSHARLLPYHETRYAEKGTQYISYARKIVDYNNTSHNYVFIMDFDSEIITTLLSSLIIGQTGNLFILNGENIVYALDFEQFSPDDVLYFSAASRSNDNHYQKRIGAIPYLVTSYPVANTTLSILCINSISEITGNVPDLKSFTLLLIAVSMLLTIVFACIFSKKIVKPIKDLKGVTYEVMKGHLDVQVPPLTHDEIGDLGLCIEKMLANINLLIQEKYEYTIREKELQLQTLQSQINPHFLYNTLETISSIAENDGLDQVSDIALSMASLYRYSISSSDCLVPIRDEVDYIRNYLDILKVRYGERILFHFDLEEDTLHYPIMKLTLQPLIENAVYHGLENKRDQGNLIISIKKLETFIQIRIIDDGIGIEPMRLKQLQDKMSNCRHDTAEKDNHHIGIHNVYKRLKLRFGDSCEMTVSSSLSDGTSVSILLPTCTEMS